MYTRAGDELVAGKPLFLDVQTLIRTRMLVQAASGQGKSHWLRRLVEKLAELKLQVFVVDHEGEFATLRKKFDFFLAGEGGDLPIDIRTAGVTAHRFLEMRANCVFDLSEPFRARPRDRHTWVKNFLEALMESPKRLWTQVVIVVDEAHKYMPEKGESEALDAMISLATDGRKREFCAIYATQRLAKVAKDGAAELLNKFIGGTSLGLDRKRAAEEMGIDSPDLKEFNRQIKTIDRGFFWTLGPAVSKDPVLVKVGDTITAAPARGSRAAGPPPPPAKVKAMLEELGDLAKVAEAKLATEKDLRAKIAELEKTIRTNRMQKVQPSNAVSAPAKAAARKITDKELSEVLEPLFAQHTERVAAWVTSFKENIEKSMQRAFENGPKPVVLEWRSLLFNAAKALNRSAGSMGETPSTGRAALLAERQPAIPRSSPRVDLDEATIDRKIGAGARRVLQALKQFHPKQLSRETIIVTAGVTARSLKDYLSILRRGAYIAERGEMVSATAEGLEAAGDVRENPSTTEERVAFWKDKLGAGAGRVLVFLVNVYPEEVDRETIVTHANVTLRSLKDYLSLLRRAKLIIENGGQTRAAESLFLFD